MNIRNKPLPSVTRGQRGFAQVPSVEIPRSTFDRSCGQKLTFDAGYLVPFFADEALPGDTFNLKMTTFGRMATLLYPIMDNIRVETFFFFVPNRLVWENWERFNGAQDNPDDSTDFTVPKMAAHEVEEGSLSDYMGLPIGNTISYNALHHRAYNLIYNDWFRSENLQDSVVVDIGDANSNISDYVLLKRGKRHDYFTSALPWTQKGDNVVLPLGTTAPIEGLITGNGAPELDAGNLTWDASFPDTVKWNSTPGGSGVADWVDPALDATGLTADLSNATAATINQIREAFQIQKLLERDARGGTRYTEIIRSHFGVTSPDGRLQRPEYLGGGSTSININPVAQSIDMRNSVPLDPNPYSLGRLAGIGTFGQDPHGFVKSFTEHGVILGLVNVRADLNYQQGVNRMWSRDTRYDFYWPSLAHLGEQEVLNKEIYSQGTSADDEVFGYQERYAEYRYKPSQISGAFRSDAATSLDVWHLALDFASLPALNDTFIQDDPPISRVVATGVTEPQFLLDCYIDFKCARPLPTYGVPGFVDRF